VSLEVRAPFLDHRVVEFAFSLDDSLRYRDGVGKWIVHQAAQRILPKGTLLLQRPVKDGLPTPVNQWLFGWPSFDRKHWNALLTAECLKSLLGRRNLDASPHSMDIEDVPLIHPHLSEPRASARADVRVNNAARHPKHPENRTSAPA